MAGQSWWRRPQHEPTQELAATAGATIVRRLASAAQWESAGAVVAALWGRAHPERVDTIVAELSETRVQLLQARRRGDEQAEQELVIEWQGRLRRLLAANPGLAPELHSLLADEPATPAAGTVSMTATASDRARIFQAGRDLHLGRSDERP
jgi:hypothetical protein